jgi:hypothetical protein
LIGHIEVNDNSDFGKMADGHAAAGEVVGNDKIVSIKSDQLDWPRIHQYQYEPNTPNYYHYPFRHGGGNSQSILNLPDPAQQP